jgi:hypothetical protein
VWFLLFPLMVASVALSFFSSSGDGLAAGTPKRTIWRRNGQVALDYHSAGSTYHDPAPWVDPKLAAALVALHCSHQEFLASDSWDAR